MKNLFCALHMRRCPAGVLVTLSLLIFSSACQSTGIPSSPTPDPTSTPLASTATEAILLPPSPATQAPTPSLQPTATSVPIPLAQQEPWLVYYHHYRAGDEIFIVNQDGTGLVGVQPDYSSDIPESSASQLVVIGGAVYLFQRSQSTWTLVQPYGSFTGSSTGGLLARFHYAAEDAFSTLRIHELPSGRLRDEFPLFKCTDQAEPCDTAYLNSGMLERRWSPNGRYLAFSAVLDGQSDLYLYDSQTGNVLRLTNGPDNVSQLWWSPDGEWIIMGELHEREYPFTTSLWAVSARNGEMRQLYSLEDGYPQGILEWLDDRRFIVFSGTSLYDPLDLPAYDLTLVNIDASRITPLYRGSFFTAELAGDRETLAVGVYNAAEPGEEYKGQGLYLVSVSDPTLRFVSHQVNQPDWDDELKLFVTAEACAHDLKGRLAFDATGILQCIYPPAFDDDSPLPASYPSPDGQWEVSVWDGTWLKATAGDRVRLTSGSATQVIWRPDSQGFFFVENEVLSYASLPEVSLRVVDQNVSGNLIHYQWLEGK